MEKIMNDYEKIKEKLDQIIGLLLSLQPNNTININMENNESEEKCNCIDLRYGSTGGWYCPVHGQQIDY